MNRTPKTSIAKTGWNEFVKKYGPLSGRFLQSWEWGEFQKEIHQHTDRHVFEEDGKVVGLMQIVRSYVPMLGFYDYIPGGPVLSDPHSVEAFFENLAGHSMFVRFDSYYAPSRASIPKASVKTIDVQPAQTLITDLRLSEEQLQKQMHHKTRYNIGLASRKGVHVVTSGGSFEDVWRLFDETAKRGQFRLHSKAYYQTMLQSLGESSCRVFLATATHEGKVIAANLMVDFDNTRTYLHGASAYEHRNLMGPYLLHWDLILDAKAKDLERYDWWGVAPSDKPKHPWAGISKFKRHFGGEELVSSGTHDYVHKPFWYGLYRVLRAIRRQL